MIYDHSTSSYMPILYALMMSKCKEAYWHAFNQIVAISEWQIRVRTYCTDFEIAMMKQRTRQRYAYRLFLPSQAGLAKVSH